MNRFFLKFRARLQRIFFWLEGAKQSREFHPTHGADHALVVHATKPKFLPSGRQLRYAGRILTAKERRTMGGAIAVLLLGFTIGSAAFSRDHLIRVPSEGGNIVEAVVGAPKYVNPLYASANGPDADLASLVYSGLFKRVQGLPVPDLVERYEWSDGGRKLHLELRKDTRFHDGTPLTTDDVVFTLNAAKDPAWRSTYVKAFENALFERIDEHTLNINLKDPDVAILDALTIGILPLHLWQEVHPGNALLAEGNTHPVGSGPFMIRSLRHDSRGAILAYTLERSEYYYGIKPFLHELEMRYFPDRSAAEEALRGGQVDAFAFVPSDALERLTNNDRLRFAALELPQETIVFMNVKDETMKNIKIRQALALAVDREPIVAAQSDIAHAVQGPYPFEAFTFASSSTEERLEKARNLLTESGWIVASNTEVRVRKDTVQNVSSTLPEATASSTLFILNAYVPDLPDLIAVAEVLKRQWSLLGVKIEIVTESQTDLMRRATESRDAQIIIWNVLLNPSQDLTPIWRSSEASGRGRNLSNLVDRNVDDALESIHEATTTESLRAARARIAETILARSPAIFLTRPAYGYVYVRGIRGVAKRLELGTPSDRLQDIPNWYVKHSWRWR